MHRTIDLIAVLFLLTGCSVPNNGSTQFYSGVGIPPNPDPNTCYVRIISPDLYSVDTIFYFGYNEFDAAKYPTQEEEIIVSPAYSRWEYVLYDGCDSDNPNDCQVLCYKTYPAKSVILDVVADTSLGTPELRWITTEYVSEKGGHPGWEEVDCELTRFNAIAVDFKPGTAELSVLSNGVIDHSLLQLMKDRPNLRIEIQGHTDSKGPATKNQRLSEERVNAVIDYLVANGIQRKRLVGRGFGESRLLNHCADGIDCTETEHEINNRIEFRVMNTEM